MCNPVALQYWSCGAYRENQLDNARDAAKSPGDRQISVDAVKVNFQFYFHFVFLSVFLISNFSINLRISIADTLVDSRLATVEACVGSIAILVWSCNSLPWRLCNHQTLQWLPTLDHRFDHRLFYHRPFDHRLLVWSLQLTLCWRTGMSEFEFSPEF